MQRELAVTGVKAFMQIVGQNAELVFRHVCRIQCTCVNRALSGFRKLFTIMVGWEEKSK